MDYKFMTNEQIWDTFVGSQTVEEFMSFFPNNTIEEAVDSYIEETDFFDDISKNNIDYIRIKLIDHIEKNSSVWAKRQDKYYPISYANIINSNIPLNSEFEFDDQDKYSEDDFRVMKTLYYDNAGNQINEEYDLQCLCRRFPNSKPQWESIVRYRFGDREKIQRMIKRLIANSKVFSIRISKEEDDTETQRKINNLILRIKEFKN